MLANDQAGEGVAMSSAVSGILKEAMALAPSDRALLVDELLSSLDQPDPRVDDLWAQEAEARIAALDAGQMRELPAEDVYAEP
jgi:putative addiction module component (TIGR02574 family)